MEIVYYPDLFIQDENLAKTISLFWETTKTIIPPSYKKSIDNFLAGECQNNTFYPDELYSHVNNELESNFLDFVVIKDIERQKAADKMFDVITNWNADTKFYDSIKINSINDLTGQTVEWYWFLHEKMEEYLISVLLEEKIVMNWSPGEMVCLPEVGKAYMSIIGNEIKNNRNIRLLTNDEYSISSKSGVNYKKFESKQDIEEGYQLVSLAIPEIFIDPISIKNLSWKDIKNIRQDILPLSENYYSEIEYYQTTINDLYKQNDQDRAFDFFCEFCERVAISFKPFSKEVNKILRKISNHRTLSFATGILLPTIKLIEPKADLQKVCDITAIALTASNYAVESQQVLSGFEYLENLNRKIKLKNLKNTITSLTPKSLEFLI